MHLHFATSFGFENVFPRLVSTLDTATNGQLQVGQKALLEWFELHLAIFNKDAANAIRTSAYKKAVTKALAKEPDLYINNSFATDAWGATEQILLWRDELVLALWDFDCRSKELKRLHALSLVESCLDDMPLGVNDRWRYVFNVLSSKRKTPLSKLTVYEPRISINPFFLQLFELLSSNGVQVSFKDMAYESNATDLGQFKQMLGSKTKTKEVAPKNDSSLAILKADNEKLLADALAVYLESNQEANPLFILQSRGAVIEQSLVNRGRPAMGCVSYVEDGSLAQLLTLITVFLWKPYDPEKLISYLTLPSAPIAKSLRLKLAQTFARSPLVYGDEWKDAISSYKANNQKQSDIDAKLDLWFKRKRYRLIEGSPVESVVALYKDLLQWANNYAHNLQDKPEQTKALKQLASQCKELLLLIESEVESGVIVSELMLHKWLGSIEKSGSSKVYRAELGSYSQVSDPAVITENHDVIIWWNFLELSNPVSSSSNWSKEEALELGDAFIYKNKARIAHWYWKLCNGIQRCTKKLVLCIPQKSQGQVVDANPLYYDLQATFSSLIPIESQVNLNAEAMSILDLRPELLAYDKKDLPIRKAYWSLPSQAKLEKRERESFSSLSSLFFYPYAYLLRYQLGIKPITIPEVTISPLLLGNLTHHSAETLWDDPEILECSDSVLKDKVTRAIDHQLEKEGAILLMPRNIISLGDFKDKAVEALILLVKMIKANGWEIWSFEKDYTQDGELPILGLIDLVLIRGSELAIVDLKWGGLGRKIEELSDEQELQLILYDRLLKEKDRRIHLHYYIISSQTMLGRNKNAFNECSVISSQTEESTLRKAIWDKMVNTYKLRWEEFDSGQVEVGDGMHIDDIRGREELYTGSEEFIQVPLSSSKKNEDRYSDYKYILGQL